ncbi:hypothetical protein ACFVR1_07610 [Psychrobacillus sp. NPDC058041]|uniref:hypothetical protein n=1 Tax=Psychrobacillus sp. NPDC058041 TaxID=3346310 RepID=UPI0036DE3584
MARAVMFIGSVIEKSFRVNTSTKMNYWRTYEAAGNAFKKSIKSAAFKQALKESLKVG